MHKIKLCITATTTLICVFSRERRFCLKHCTGFSPAGDFCCTCFRLQLENCRFELLCWFFSSWRLFCLNHCTGSSPAGDCLNYLKLVYWFLSSYRLFICTALYGGGVRWVRWRGCSGYGGRVRRVYEVRVPWVRWKGTTVGTVKDMGKAGRHSAYGGGCTGVRGDGASTDQG